VIRHDYTVEEVRALHDLPLNRLVWQAQSVHQEHHRAARGPALLAAVGEDRRLPGGLRLLPAVVEARGHGRRADDEPRRGAGRGRAGPRRGATRFCMGAAWREVKDGPAFDSVLEMVRGVRGLGMEACVTLGMLTDEQARRLGEAGLTAYNHNLDTSREFYGRSSPPAPSTIACTRSSACARPASPSARAASSAWASRSTIAAPCW
jgi:biotin synthase